MFRDIRIITGINAISVATIAPNEIFNEHPKNTYEIINAATAKAIPTA